MTIGEDFKSQLFTTVQDLTYARSLLIAAIQSPTVAIAAASLSDALIGLEGVVARVRAIHQVHT